jgi:hypothetical protein
MLKDTDILYPEWGETGVGLVKTQPDGRIDPNFLPPTLAVYAEPLAPGEVFHVVSGLNLESAIASVVISIGMPDDEGSILLAAPVINSFSQDGFRVNFSGPVPAAGYVMYYSYTLA